MPVAAGFGHARDRSALTSQKRQRMLHPAANRHIFQVPAEQMWQMILREMGGKYASMSMIPEDLSLN